ncbi:MAG TPA: chemotaxis protein CheB, partial [Thermoanaerobaculia bacterium]
MAQKKTSVQPPSEPSKDSQFPIVGAGASAGGLEAFTELLRSLPDRPGMAFIFVQHQEPKHVSMLPEILARNTSMKVRQVSGDELVEADHVYVAPPDTHVLINDGRLQLATGGTGSMPIDHFLRSLAEDQGNRAIGVILSGAGSDGSLGIGAIKAEGGITFAEDQTAKFDSMPRSAMAAGSIDFVMPPSEIANELVRIGQQWHRAKRIDEKLPEKQLEDLFKLLQRSHDIDFSNYKRATIERRVRRRMMLNKLDTIDRYLAFIHDRPAELEELYGDVLIRVTNFFRDPQVFEALQQDVFPEMFRAHRNGDPIRFWVPGCATGEEVYS